MRSAKLAKVIGKGRAVTFALGFAVLGLGGLVALNWEAVYWWWHGWQIVWMPRPVSFFGSGRVLNSAGQAAVIIWDENGPQAARWSIQTGEAVSLGAPSVLHHRTPSVAVAIAEDGTVIGLMSESGGPDFVNRQGRSFLWTEREGMVEIGFPFQAGSVNSRRQVAGCIVNFAKGDVRGQAVLWTREGGVRRVYASGKTDAGGCATAVINEKGWVAGARIPAGAFLWKPETGMRDIWLPLGSSSMIIWDFNEQGQILVTAERGGAVPGSVPYVWSENDGWRELPFPRGYAQVRGLALNNEGTVLLSVIVGPDIGDKRADGYLVRGGKLVKLPAPRRWNSLGYLGLNDKGWVAGAADRDGRSGPGGWRGFVLIPVQ